MDEMLGWRWLAQWWRLRRAICAVATDDLVMVMSVLEEFFFC